ncbi:hypothetical protein NOR51B_801 [Luminiphilus syltensis NOR5-1B]|uniref:Uncharacterized protein n=1 Tax=Luminiphilus syltensis NOR5-1B TaxID=565045 RepID=B8KQV2_9GAMM|nr:hypothetical protein [Luminiphilus syltensis]EED34861.1 hypothetical protein NOR51B_801 [Luminiphilus syltensis NOR5-1B]
MILAAPVSHRAGLLKLFLPVVQEVFRERAPKKWEHYFPGLNQHLQMAAVPLWDHFIST